MILLLLGAFIHPSIGLRLKSDGVCRPYAELIPEPRRLLASRKFSTRRAIRIKTTLLFIFCTNWWCYSKRRRMFRRKVAQRRLLATPQNTRRAILMVLRVHCRVYTYKCNGMRKRYGPVLSGRVEK